MPTVSIVLADTDLKLEGVIRRLVEAYQPRRIYLFGSVARGEAGPDSDYDLLVLVSGRRTSRTPVLAGRLPGVARHRCCR